jgi:hypothetical protein
MTRAGKRIDVDTSLVQNLPSYENGVIFERASFYLGAWLSKATAVSFNILAVFSKDCATSLSTSNF